MPPRHPGRDHLQRLTREAYCGRAFVHWTFTVENRTTGWLTPRFHAAFRETLLHTLVRADALSPVYCLMPDHLHILLVGTCLNSDLYLAARFLRTHLRPHLAPVKFQKQGFDHVLREHERARGAFSAVCYYILQNPVRAGLVENAKDHPFSGAMLPGYPKVNVHAEDYWDLFWRVYDATK